MLGVSRDVARLCKYDPEWVVEYKKEAKIVKEILKDYALDIQHVGSTSIVGLSAKPIIDIAVAVKNKEVLNTIIPVMQNAGYEVKPSIEDKGEVLAIKGEEQCRTHYIHIEVKDGEYWQNHILFRDYLLKHPNAVKEYENLKMHLCKLYQNERKVYTASKNDFIKSIIEKAKQENWH